MNTEYFQDCGNGTICSKHAGCEFPSGCVLVAPRRTQQIGAARRAVMIELTSAGAGLRETFGSRKTTFAGSQADALTQCEERG